MATDPERSFDELAEQAGDQLPPLVTEDELDLSVIFPKDRTIKIPVAGMDGDRPNVREFRVRGRLTIDDLGHLLDLETKLDRGLELRREILTRKREHPELADIVTEEEREVIKIVLEANSYIRDLVAARNEDVPESLGLDEEAVMVTMSWLVGDVSVADAVARAITAGVSGSMTEEAIREQAAARLEGEQSPLASGASS